MKTTFTDLQGGTWDLKITVKHYISFKEQGIVDIATIFDNEDFLSGLLNHSDMLVFLGVLHELCEGQYVDHGVMDADAFFSRFDGDVMADAAEAFIGAVVAFLPAHRRDAMREAYTTVRMGLTAAGEKAAEELSSNRQKHLHEIDKKISQDMSNFSRKISS